MARKPRSEIEILMETLQKSVATVEKLKIQAKTPEGLANLIESLGGKPVEQPKPLSKEAESVIRIMQRSPSLAKELLKYATFLSKSAKSAQDEG